MDVIFFFLGILVIVLATSATTALGLYWHHQRESYRVRIREQEVSQMYLLSKEKLDIEREQMRSLPPRRS